MNWLYAKAAAVLAFLGAVFLFKREKEKHKETKRKLAESDDRLIKRMRDKEITEGIELIRKERNKQAKKAKAENERILRDLENETDDHTTVVSIRKLLNDPKNKD